MNAEPIPMRLHCPKCNELHVDEGEFSAKPHHTHSCQHCGMTWRPAVVATVGVRFLPGFKCEELPIDWGHVLPHGIRVDCSCGCDTNAPGANGYMFYNGQWKCGECQFKESVVVG